MENYHLIFRGMLVSPTAEASRSCDLCSKTKQVLTTTIP